MRQILKQFYCTSSDGYVIQWYKDLEDYFNYLATFYLHFSFHQHDIQSFAFDHIQQHLLKADVAHFKIRYTTCNWFQDSDTLMMAKKLCIIIYSTNLCYTILFYSQHIGLSNQTLNRYQIKLPLICLPHLEWQFYRPLMRWWPKTHIS